MASLLKVFVMTVNKLITMKIAYIDAEAGKYLSFRREVVYAIPRIFVKHVNDVVDASLFDVNAIHSPDSSDSFAFDFNDENYDIKLTLKKLGIKFSEVFIEVTETRKRLS